MLVQPTEDPLEPHWVYLLTKKFDLDYGYA
jgi:hypothetical protein